MDADLPACGCCGREDPFTDPEDGLCPACAAACDGAAADDFDRWADAEPPPQLGRCERPVRLNLEG